VGDHAVAICWHARVRIRGKVEKIGGVQRDIREIREGREKMRRGGKEREEDRQIHRQEGYVGRIIGWLGARDGVGRHDGRERSSLLCRNISY
jgi:hypothetical protein